MLSEHRESELWSATFSKEKMVKATPMAAHLLLRVMLWFHVMFDVI